MSSTQSHNATYPDMLGKFETYVGKLASVQPDLMGLTQPNYDYLQNQQGIGRRASEG